jgi:hypothetical protein
MHLKAINSSLLFLVDSHAPAEIFVIAPGQVNTLIDPFISGHYLQKNQTQISFPAITTKFNLLQINHHQKPFL